MKMTRIRKNWIVILVILASAMLLATGVVYALFTNNIKYSFNMDSQINASLELTDAGVQKALGKPGDVYTREFTVKNTSETDVALAYDLELSIQSSSLAASNSVYVRLDGELLGVLRQLLVPVTENGVETGEYRFAMPVDLPLAQNESRTHTLELEFHIATIDGATKTLAYSVTAVGRTDANYGKYLFVSSEDDLIQIARQNAKKGVHGDRTLYLTRDITLTKDLNLSNTAIDLDLNGHKLILGDHNVNFGTASAGVTGVSKLYNSRNRDSEGNDVSGARIERNGGAILLSSPNGLLLADPALFATPDGAVVFAHQSTDTVLDFSASLFRSEYIADWSKRMGDGLLSGTYAERGVFSVYPHEVVSSDGSPVKVNADHSIVVTQREVTEWIPLTLTCGGVSEPVTVKVWGTQAGFCAEFIQNNVPYLVSAQSGETPLDVNFDLFLPKVGRESGVTVNWISENSAVLSSSGKCYAVAADTQIRLLAQISANGRTELVTFFLNVKAKDAEQLLKDFAILKAPQFDSVGKTITLPDETDELAKQYGITDLSYQLSDDMLGCFSLTGNDLTLVKATSQEVFYMTITGTIKSSADDPGETKKVQMPVYVAMSGSVSMVEQAHNSVLDQLGKRKSKLEGVTLPDVYNSVTVKYDLVSSETAEELQGRMYLNPKGAADYVTIDGSQIGIVAHKLPIENTVIYVRAEYRYGNSAPEKYVLELPVAGVVHNDADGIEDFTLYTNLCMLFDANGDWLLTRDEIDEGTATRLQISNKSIKSLKGLEFFTQFGDVNLSNNLITDISALANCSAIVTLDLSGNHISDVSALANMPILSKLNLADNKVSDLSVLKNARNLSDLDLSGNTGVDDFGFVELLENLASLNIVGCFGFEEDSAKPRYYSIYSAFLNYRETHGNDPIYTVTGAGGTATLSSSNSTDSQRLLATKILKGIQTVYRVGDTIYLPFSVYYDSASYVVIWSEIKALESDENVVEITQGNGTGTAKVIRPIGDKQIRLRAEISIGQSVQRIFSVIIKSDGQIYEVQTGKNSDGSPIYSPADSVVLDSDLRSFLFKNFDADKNGKLETSEMEAVTILDLTNRNISDITGLECFVNLNELNLTGNSARNLNVLEGCLKLKTLTLSEADYDFSEIVNLSSLTVLNASESLNVQASESEVSLFLLFENTSGKINIYKDSKTSVWDPYKIFLQKQLSAIEDVILLANGTTKVLEVYRTAVMYPGTEAEKRIELKYTFAAETFRYLRISQNEEKTQYTLEYQSDNAYDSMEDMKITVARNAAESKTYNKRSTVVALADRNVMVELPELETDGISHKTDKLYNRVQDSAVIEQLLGVYRAGADQPVKAGNKLITREMIESVSTLTFSGTSNTELFGLELFAGSGLKKLVLNNYHAAYNRDGTRISTSFSRQIGFWNQFPNLTELSFSRSVVDFFDFNTGKFEKIDATDCLYLILDRFDSGSMRESAFASMTTLTYLDLSFNNVIDFWSIGYLPNAVTLYLFGNPGAKSGSTDRNVKSAYLNLLQNMPDTAYDYQISAKNEQWIPDSRNISLAVTLNGEALVSGIGHANTVQPSDELILPEFFSFVEMGQGTDGANYVDSPVTWTSSASSVVRIENNKIARIVGTEQAVVILTGSASEIGQKLVYVLFVAGTESDLWGAFVKPGSSPAKLEDPLFAYYIFEELRNLAVPAEPENSVFSANDALAITSLYYPDNAVRSIRGIQKLLNLRTIDLTNNSIRDISELANLTLLTSIRMGFNQIETLWLDATERLYVDNDGNVVESGSYYIDVRSSVFRNLSNLSELRIQKNVQIDDYGAISFQDNRQSLKSATNGTSAKEMKVQSVSRDGLANLKKVTSFAQNIQNNHLGTGYSQYGNGPYAGVLSSPNQYNYVVAWFDAVRKLTASNDWDKDIWPLLKNLELCMSDTTENGTMTRNTLQSIYGDCKAFETIQNELLVDTLLDGSKGFLITSNVSTTPKSLPTKFKVDNINPTSPTIEIPIKYTVTYPLHADKLPVPIQFDSENSYTSKITGVNGELQTTTHQFYMVAVATNIHGVNMLIPTEYRKVDGSDNAVTKKVQIAKNNVVDAKTVFKDEIMLNTVFSILESSSQQTIDILTPALVNKFTASTLDLKSRGIADFSGLEYILKNNDKITSVNLSFNRIESIPVVEWGTRTQDLTLNFSECQKLKDLSGFSKTLNGGVSLGSIVTGLNFTGCIGVNSDEMSSLNGNICTKLKSLTITGMNLADYSFLTTLNKSLTSFNMAYVGSDIPPQLKLNNNLESVREMYLTTKNNLATSSFPYFGADAKLFGEYLYLPFSFDASQEIWLPNQIQVFGKQFTVAWTNFPSASMDGSAVVKQIGSDFYTVFKLKADADVSEIKLNAQLSYDGYVSYQEEVVLIFESDSAASTDTMILDAKIDFDNDGLFEESEWLSKFVPDEMLRYYILQAYVSKLIKADGDYHLSHANFIALTSLNVGENFSYRPNFGQDASTGKYATFGIISSLEGLQIFKDTNVTGMHFYAINTTDFSPISDLVKLTYVDFNNCVIDDFSFMLKLTNVTNVLLYMTSYSDLAFLSDLPNLKYIQSADINYHTPKQSAHVLNSLAYARVFQGLDDIVGNSQMQSTRDDEKLGAVVLDQLDTSAWNFAVTGTGKDSYYLLDGSKYSNGETLVVPGSIVYDGKTAKVTVRPLTYGSVDIAGNDDPAADKVLKFQKNTTGIGNDRSFAKFVVRIEYDGGFYERFFQMNFAA